MSPVGRLSLDRFCAHLSSSIKDRWSAPPRRCFSSPFPPLPFLGDFVAKGLLFREAGVRRKLPAARSLQRKCCAWSSLFLARKKWRNGDGDCVLRTEAGLAAVFPAIRSPASILLLGQVLRTSGRPDPFQQGPHPIIHNSGSARRANHTRSNGSGDDVQALFGRSRNHGRDVLAVPSPRGTIADLFWKNSEWGHELGR